jgi:Zn-dependent metalloprotease
MEEKLKKHIFSLLFISCFTFVSTLAIGSELTIEELSIVEKLFEINNINHDENIKAVRVQETRHGSTVITCEQFYKGLLVVNGSFNYIFSSDGIAGKERNDTVFILGEENLINHQDVDVNINPIVSKAEAFQLFVEKTRSYGKPYELREIKKMLLELDSYSHDIALGVYINKYNVLSMGSIPDYILVWQVTFEDKEYPKAIIDANNGKFLNYDSGIRH